MLLEALIDRLSANADLPALVDLYGNTPGTQTRQKERYLRLARQFKKHYPTLREVEAFSVPGRTEVGGNHTDHNGGRVLAAAVALDIVALAAPSGDGLIRIASEGYPEIVVDLSQLEMVEQEKFTSIALVRGVCYRMKQLGYEVQGFSASMNSRVPTGSGLSSSAAFEVMIVHILNHLYNDGRIDPILNAQISQFAENEYFGKPSGLMDQTTCAVGGFVTIDFKDSSKPVVHKVNYDFSSSGYTLAIVGTGGSHADLNEDYASIAIEMKAIAQALGGKVLRDVTKEAVMDNLASLRARVNDRAILRAIHFFEDDARVVKEAEALESGDFPGFLSLILESGRSSWMLLQNIFTNKLPEEQGLALAQVIARAIIGERGAWRVHGGGFAGTIQVFVPADCVDEFQGKMAAVFGAEHVHLISIRSQGAVRLEI